MDDAAREGRLLEQAHRGRRRCRRGHRFAWRASFEEMEHLFECRQCSHSVQLRRATSAVTARALRAGLTRARGRGLRSVGDARPQLASTRQPGSRSGPGGAALVRQDLSAIPSFLRRAGPRRAAAGTIADPTTAAGCAAAPDAAAADHAGDRPRPYLQHRAIEPGPASLPMPSLSRRRACHRRRRDRRGPADRSASLHRSARATAAPNRAEDLRAANLALRTPSLGSRQDLESCPGRAVHPAPGPGLRRGRQGRGAVRPGGRSATTRGRRARVGGGPPGSRSAHASPARRVAGDPVRPGSLNAAGTAIVAGVEGPSDGAPETASTLRRRMSSGGSSRRTIGSSRPSTARR